MKQLFKYLPEPRNIFEEGFIRLSQPVALNDPFEGAFCNQNLDELASYFDDNQAHDYVYGDIPFSEYPLWQDSCHHLKFNQLGALRVDSVSL